MKDTTNIKPISAFLSSRVGLPASVVKERLGIGRLYGKRCDLVHNGVLPETQRELLNINRKLECMCEEILRAVMGFSYDGRLDRYVNGS